MTLRSLALAGDQRLPKIALRRARMPAREVPYCTAHPADAEWEMHTSCRLLSKPAVGGTTGW